MWTQKTSGYWAYLLLWQTVLQSYKINDFSENIYRGVMFQLYSKPWTTLFSPVTNNNFVSPDPVCCMGKWSHLKVESDCQTEAWLLEELTRRQNMPKISCNVVLRCEILEQVWNMTSYKLFRQVHKRKPVSKRRISKYGLSYFNNNSYALAGKFSKQCSKYPKHRSEKDSNLRIQSVSCLLNGLIPKAMPVTVSLLFIIFNYCYYLSLSWHSWLFFQQLPLSDQTFIKVLNFSVKEIWNSVKHTQASSHVRLLKRGGTNVLVHFPDDGNRDGSLYVSSFCHSNISQGCYTERVLLNSITKKTSDFNSEILPPIL